MRGEEVNIRDPACVAILSAVTGSQIGLIAVSSTGPYGLDLDPMGAQAFDACDGGAVAVIDVETRQELAMVPIAGEPDAIWYSPRRQCLYVSVGNPGVIDVVDCRTLQVQEQIVTEVGAYTTAYDEHRQRVYVFLPGSCRAAVYNDL